MSVAFTDLQEFCRANKLRLILASDAEPVVSVKKDHGTTTYVPAGGVAVALEPLARASNCVYIARGKTKEDKQNLNLSGKIRIGKDNQQYELKRIFLSENEMTGYYYGFANQTLWPLCHVAFEPPIFHNSWFDQYKRVNAKFAKAIEGELKKGALVWINDYQLALVPSLLKKSEAMIGFFWHIPWPTWEIFRILPQKRAILESLLCCDFIGFHRGYQADNFIETVERELEARIDRENSRIFYKNHVTTVVKLPMGIDTDVVKTLAQNLPQIAPQKPVITEWLHKLLRIQKKTEAPVKELPMQHLFKHYRVILGVDRLDYTKGLRARLDALDMFLTNYPKYKKKVVYLGILSPSREQVPAYKKLKQEVFKRAAEINRKHRTTTWKPIVLLSTVLSRQTLVQLYKKSEICLVTPLDDGMNLVSKEYVMAANQNDKPGMLILSQFAGSSIDLTESVIVNPYDREAVAIAIDAALSLPDKERRSRMNMMAQTLEERNVYRWTEEFITQTKEAARQNKKH